MPLCDFLPQLLATFTGPRQRIRPGENFSWSDTSILYNAFRVYEIVFGRKDGIRLEMTSGLYFDEEGRQVVVYQFHTLEAALVHAEHVVRTFFKRFRLVRVYLNVPALAPAGFSVPSPQPYLFAVAFDAATSGSSTGAQTSYTISHTTTGSNPFITSYVSTDGGQTSVVSSVAYAGVNESSVNSLGNASSNSFNGIWCKGACATGANNVVISLSASKQIYSINQSYSGAQSSSTPDANATQTDSTSPYQITTTTTRDNAWVGIFARGGSNLTASTNVSFRATPFSTIVGGDSAGVVHPAGAFTQSITDGGTQGETALLTIAIAPYTAPTGFFGFFAMTEKA